MGLTIGSSRAWDGPKVGRFPDPDTSQTISGLHAWFTNIDGITRTVSAPT